MSLESVLVPGRLGFLADAPTAYGQSRQYECYISLAYQFQIAEEAAGYFE